MGSPPLDATRSRTSQSSRGTAYQSASFASTRISVDRLGYAVLPMAEPSLVPTGPDHVFLGVRPLYWVGGRRSSGGIASAFARKVIGVKRLCLGHPFGVL